MFRNLNADNSLVVAFTLLILTCTLITSSDVHITKQPTKHEFTRSRNDFKKDNFQRIIHYKK